MNKVKKIKVDWTPTMAEDLFPHYGIDTEGELLVELHKEIVKELKRLDKLDDEMPTVTDRINPITVSLDKNRRK